MGKIRVSAGAGALLPLAVLYFFDTSGVFSAMLPAVIVHEAGHTLAIRGFGGRVSGLRLSFAGLSMDYRGNLSQKAFILSALAGPLAGALFSVALSAAGKALGSDYLLCTAGVSCVLSAFNLLPAPMLDGGRALESLLPPHARIILGFIVGGCLLLAGLYCAMYGLGAALIPAGIWVVVCTCKTPAHDI